MERYLLFVWDQHYPLGGMNDLHGQFEDRVEAINSGKQAVKGDGLKRFQVWDIVEGQKVTSGHGDWDE